MDVSRRCHHPQSSTTSKPNPGVTGRPAAAASVAWPHGRRPQAEAIESSGQGEEEWGEKEGRRKEEQTVAVLYLLSRGWPCYYYSTTLG